LEEGRIILSHKEIDRLSVIQRLEEDRISQQEAAQQLKISVRQVRRVLKRYRQEGAAGLTSRRRGKVSNNRLSDALRVEIQQHVAERYADFNPTLAHEKLTECHGYRVSVETVRQLMMEATLWKPKSRRIERVFQLRERRARFGELIQIDGSPHDWFEGRAASCTLIVFIDDATSRLTSLWFSPTETTEAYMMAMGHHLERHGRPASFYSDCHSIFRINQEDTANGNTLTQFGRALKTLDVEAIHARTPQAKGRVERANQTLQDRLVKEMRLQGINSIEQANAWLPTFMEDYNQRFGRQAKDTENAHREVLHTARELSLIQSHHETRTVSKSLEIQYQNVVYQIQEQGKGYRLQGQTVTVCTLIGGDVVLLKNGKELRYKTYQKSERPSSVEDEKTLNARVDAALERQRQRSGHKPAPDHPWRKILIKINSPPREPCATK
jgi:transposase